MTKGIVHSSIACLLLILSPHSSAATIADLRISEVMINPVALADRLGEWFELFNPTDRSFNLRGLSIEDDGRDRHRFDSDLLILPGEYLTLARSAQPGFVPDYVYDGFGLSNSNDEIVFSDGSAELLRLDYKSGFALPGQSRVLADSSMLADNYLLSEDVYYLGDRGTPGFGYQIAPKAVTLPIPATITLFLAALAVVGLFKLTRYLRCSSLFVMATRLRNACDGRSSRDLILPPSPIGQWIASATHG